MPIGPRTEPMLLANCSRGACGRCWLSGACTTRRIGAPVISEKDIDTLEQQFPAVSGSVFAAARDRVLASGQSVLISEDGIIYEIFPDGTRKQVKEIDPPIAVERGKKIHLG